MSNERPMGLILGMPFESYHAVDAMSASGMRELARSPWHYRNRVRITPTRSMLNGTLAHCAVLEPDALFDRYRVVPEDAPTRPSQRQWMAKNPNESSKAAMVWWTQFQQDCGTREIVSAEDFATTKAQLLALEHNRELAEMLRDGDSEVSLFWIDPDTGVYCKARPDHIPPRRNGRRQMLDLKAMADDSPEGFKRSVARMGYHRQRAHYMRGFEVVTGERIDDFVFAVVSSAPPVLASAYRLVDEACQQGDDEVRELLEEYARCSDANHWSAYSPEQRMIDLPVWAKASGEVEVSYAD